MNEKPQPREATDPYLIELERVEAKEWEKYQDLERKLKQAEAIRRGVKYARSLAMKQLRQHNRVGNAIAVYWRDRIFHGARKEE